MSPTKRPSSVAGLRRGVGTVPVSEKRVSEMTTTEIQSLAAPGRRPRAGKPKPVRFTLDLDQARHQFLKSYATGIEAGAAEVMRALLDQLRDDPALADRVRDAVWRA